MPAYYTDEEFRAAVHACWTKRRDAQARQIAQGLITDVGLRSGVTAGRHLDALTALVARIITKAGMPETAVSARAKMELPGYFRAEKQWDVVVVHRGQLIAAVEVKSILGSYGNNLNNRAEEAIGNAHDLRRAHEAGLFSGGPQAPWLGYIFIMQSDAKSSVPVKTKQPHFPVAEAFGGASYLERAELLCHRLQGSGLYDQVCFITSDGGTLDAVRQPSADLTFSRFVSGLVDHVVQAI